MKKLFLILFLLAGGPLYGQVQPDVGDQIYNSKKDMLYLRQGGDPCPLAYTVKGRHLLCGDASMGGGSGTGATQMTETVSTATGQPYVETVKTIPANSIIFHCFFSTTTAVFTTSSGVAVGVAGSIDRYGTADGSLLSGNVDDAHWPAIQPVYVTKPIRITVLDGGTFIDDSGQVFISCSYIPMSP